MAGSKMLSDRDLCALLEAEKADALASQQASKLTDERESAMNYYNGDMAADMPSIEGRSSAVSTDVADTIEGMLPDLLEIFAGSEEVIRFNPVGKEDVPLAEQETQYVNHVFMQKNEGFLILYTFFKDALLSKNGIVKIDWREEKREERETFLGQPDDVFALVANKPELEIVEHTEHPAVEGGGDYGPTHDFTVVAKSTYGCAKVFNVPPEEFGVARRTRTLRDAPYCFHEVSRSQQELIDEGYDADQVSDLPTYGSKQKQEANARDTVSESSETSGDSALNKAMRPIRVTEHCIRMDYDGTGARLYRVTTAGETAEILKRSDGEKSVVSIDFVPYASITPVIVTHRFFGRSIADLTMDIQRIKTALLRALLDNAYLAVNPITEVAENMAGGTTLDDLLVRRPGGIVRTKMPGGVNIIEHPGVGDDVFPLFEYQDSVREWRTGITRQGVGLDPNALNNQSATAAAQLYSAAKARLRLIARIFAETGVKDLFWLLHATIRKNASKEETVQVSNNWISVDPREWKTRHDLTISVGLGTGSKQEQLAGANMIANFQKEALVGGLSNLVSPKNVYNTAAKIVRLVGEKSVELYFTDPDTVPAPEPKQDPEMLKIQGQLQIEKMQADADVATSQTKAQMDIKRIEAELMRDDQAHQWKMQEMHELHAAKMQQMQYKNVADHLQHERSMKEKSAQGRPN